MHKNDAPDYAAVLADLRKRRAQLDAAIQAIETVIGTPGGAARAPAPKAPPSDKQSAAQCFVGLSVIDAAKKHLQRTGHSLRTTQILSALQDGGVALTGKSPINSLGAVLNSNLRKGAGLVRERRGVWALAAWQATQPEATSGARTVDLARLLGSVVHAAPQADAPGLPPASMPVPGPARTSALQL